tara:strand:- start:247 stop:606 length:360 start_codon:yes stop_codon:yes gene_type:complete
MSSYTTTGNKNASGQDVQGPKSLPASAYGKANLPAVELATEGADQIIINGQTSGSYFISTTITGSAGAYVGPGEMTEIYNTAGAGADASPVILNVSATAWSGSGGPAAGDVTFVYRGGL